jgi:hypothetical protein
MEVRDIQLTNHAWGYVWIKPRDQSQTLQIYPQGRQEISYSAVRLVFSFSISISDYVTYYLDFVLHLHLNFITWSQTSDILNVKTNSFINFHGSLSRSASHNKHYTRQLQITDTAHTKIYTIRVTLQTQPQINGNVSRIQATSHTHKPLILCKIYKPIHMFYT